MKKAIIKALSVLLVVVITLTSAPLSGFVGLQLPEWLNVSTNAKALDGVAVEDGWDSGLDGDLGGGFADGWDEVYFYENHGFIGDNACQMSVDGSDVIFLYGSGEINYNYNYFTVYPTINKVFLDSRISYIGEYTFSNCSSLTDIYYTGTEEQWNQMLIADYNEYIYSANIHYNSEMPAGQFDTGAFWLFDETTSTLALRGEGGTDDYDEFGSRPWDKYWSDILYIDAGFHISSFIGDYAFSSLYYLKYIRNSEYIFAYGKGAFKNCKNLMSVDVNGDVFQIGDNAFENCTNLSYVTIDYSEYQYLTIGDSAFENCYSLTSITIPDSVTSIGNSAFAYCDSLTDASIGNGVTTIGDSAFEQCSSLTSITIPDSVTSIGDSAFFGCDSLTSINIPDNIASIGDSAFRDCSSLVSLTIPDGITSIGYQTFFCCRSLSSLVISQSLAYVGVQAFCGCESLTDIYYYGTENEWKNIIIVESDYDENYGDDNAPLLDATVHYLCESGDIIGGDITGGDLGVDFVEHSYTSETTLSPTCTEKGIITHTCGNCGNSYIEEIPASGHTYESVVTDATDSQYGLTSYVCTVCGYESLVFVNTVYFIEGFSYKSNTVEDLLYVINDESVIIKILNIEGIELTENDLIGTGSTVYYYDGLTNELIDEYKVVIYGDVNGDGFIDNSDKSIIVSVATCKGTIENEWCLMAADTNHDGAVDGFDVIETDLQGLDMHNIEQKNSSAYLSKNEEDESKPNIGENDPDGDGWWG